MTVSSIAIKSYIMNIKNLVVVKKDQIRFKALILNKVTIGNQLKVKIK
mgnify:CR=1 FL=1